MLEINCISVYKYRNLRNLFIPWKRSALIYGPNGSGKSNLLRAVHLFLTENLANTVGDEEYSAAGYFKGFDFFEENKSDPQNRFDLFEKYWKLNLLTELFGPKDYDIPGKLCWIFRISDARILDHEGPFVALQLEKSEFDYHRSYKNGAILPLSNRDSLLEKLSCNEEDAFFKSVEAGFANRLDLREQTVNMPAIFSYRTECFVEDLLLQFDIDNDTFYVEVDTIYAVDLLETVNCILRNVPTSWRSYIDSVLKNIGIKVTRTSKDGVDTISFNYSLDREFAIRAPEYTIDESEVNHDIDLDWFYVFVSIIDDILGSNSSYCNEEPVALPAYHPDYFEDEIDPRRFISHYVSATTSKSLERDVRGAIEERYCTFRNMLKEFDRMSNEPGTSPFLWNQAIYEYSLREYLKNIYGAYDNTWLFFLKRIEEEVNEWLDGLFLGSLQIKIAADKAFPDLSIMVRDFGTQDYYSLGSISSGGLRWIEVGFEFALGAFNNTTRYLEQENMSIFNIGQDDDDRWSLSLDSSLYDNFAEGNMAELENRITIENTLRYRRYREKISVPIAIIDEPEMHLHPSLQERVSRNLESLSGDSKVLLASHSVSFLNMDSSKIDFFELYKENSRSLVRKISKENWDALSLAVQNTGATKGQLIQLNCALLYVEGLHDRMMLQGLFGSELSRYGIDIITIDGFLKPHFLKEVIKYFSRYTNKPQAVMYDDVREEISEYLKSSDLSLQIEEKSKGALLRQFEQDFHDMTGTERALLKLCLQFLCEGVSVTNLSLTGKDICVYIPEKYILEMGYDFPGWKAAYEEFEQWIKEEKPDKKDKNFKKFCSKSYGVDIDEKFFRKAIGLMNGYEYRPKEIENKVHLLIKEIETSQTFNDK